MTDDTEVSDLKIRRYEPTDATAVQTLHELAFEDVPTDPNDIPGTEDLREIEAAYIDAGGDFLVGVLPTGSDVLEPGRHDRLGEALRVRDGVLVAMGGFLPASEGYEDERSIDGAAELHRMRVAPALKRRGYGRKLLGALESSIRTAGFDPILATTAKRQHAAVRFYRSEGYERTEESSSGEYTLIHFQKQIG